MLITRGRETHYHICKLEVIAGNISLSTLSTLSTRACMKNSNDRVRSRHSGYKSYYYLFSNCYIRHSDRNNGYINCKKICIYCKNGCISCMKWYITASYKITKSYTLQSINGTALGLSWVSFRINLEPFLRGI